MPLFSKQQVVCGWTTAGHSRCTSLGTWGQVLGSKYSKRLDCTTIQVVHTDRTSGELLVSGSVLLAHQTNLLTFSYNNSFAGALYNGEHILRRGIVNHTLALEDNRAHPRRLGKHTPPLFTPPASTLPRCKQNNTLQVRRLVGVRIFSPNRMTNADIFLLCYGFPFRILYIGYPMVPGGHFILAGIFRQYLTHTTESLARPTLQLLSQGRLGRQDSLTRCSRPRSFLSTGGCFFTEKEHRVSHEKMIVHLVERHAST